MASEADGDSKYGKHPILKFKENYYIFRRSVLSVSYMINAQHQFMNIDDPMPDAKRDEDGNLTYTLHTKNDAKLVGIITNGVQHRALSDLIHKELGRLSRMDKDHPDFWQQNFQHICLWTY